MALTFNVTVIDQVGGYDSYVPLIKTDLAYAGLIWAASINSSASIEVLVRIRPTGTASGGAATNVFLGTDGTDNYFRYGTIAEMLSGVDPNGLTQDVNISIDPVFMEQSLYFDPAPSPTSSVPSDRVDAVETFEHELGHAFGINGFRDSTGASRGSLSTFDAQIALINGAPHFTGGRAEAVYGGPVPLTLNNIFHIGNAGGVPDLSGDIMNGFIAPSGKSPGPSALDLALLADAGVPMFGFGSTRGDFDGDGRSDVLFSQSGAVFASNYEWQLNNRLLVGEGAIDLYDKAFSVQVTGDFDGDGKADVLFQNPATGGVWEWRLDGRTVLSQGPVDVGDSSFHLLGSGDCNGDGRDDLLFRNDGGFVYQWQMNGRIDTPFPVGSLDPNWHVQGTGDFTPDGRDDILLHYKNAGNAADPANGAFVVWQMNGNIIINTLAIERPDASWQTLGIGDFNGDGIDDLAIRNVSNSPDNGAVWVYLLAGTVTSHGDGSKTLNILAQGAAGIADAATWHLQRVGDMDGDGKDDILYRNDSGFFYSWNMNGTTIASEGLLQGAAQWADPSFAVVKPHWDLV